MREALTRVSCKPHVVAYEQDMSSDHLNIETWVPLQTKTDVRILPNQMQQDLAVGRVKTVDEPIWYLKNQLCFQDEVSNYKLLGLLYM